MPEQVLMRFSPLVLCCWPGLPRLWLLGDWFALAIAVGFGTALNFLMLSSIQGLDVLSVTSRTWAWLLVGGLWLFSMIRAYHNLPNLSRQVDAGYEGSDDRGLFIQAQGEYLRGNWFEAETLLQQLLRISQTDIDAHFLLATLYRRTRRFDEAHARLNRMEQLDQVEKWRWEMVVERRLMQRMAKNSDAE
jgi:hypothetical protein